MMVIVLIFVFARKNVIEYSQSRISLYEEHFKEAKCTLSETTTVIWKTTYFNFKFVI